MKLSSSCCGSLEAIGVSPDFVEAARREHLNAASEVDKDVLKEASWHPLEGGFNNGVYSVECAGRKFCFKFYKVDGKQRALREWTALGFLRKRKFGYVPRPFYYEEDDRAPLVVMEFVEGESLGYHHLDREQLGGLFERVEELHAISCDAAVENLRALDGQTRLEGMDRRMRGVDPAGRDEKDCLVLWCKWMQGAGPELVSAPAELIFSRMDDNLANCLWDGRDMRFVDLEYGGWTDRAFDLAEQVEHGQSRSTPHVEWEWFVGQFVLSAEEHRRFEAAQRLMVFFWARLYGLRKGIEPSEKFTAQVERVRWLCSF